MKNKIFFNNTEYEILDSVLANRKNELKNHLSSVMNGSGSVIMLDDVSYNIDSAKLATATNDFISHLGTIAGSGEKKGAVKYDSPAREKIYINTSLSKEEVVEMIKDLPYTNTSYSWLVSPCYVVYLMMTTRANRPGMTFLGNSLYIQKTEGQNFEYRICIGNMDLSSSLEYGKEIFNSTDGWMNVDVFLNEDGSIKNEFLTGTLPVLEENNTGNGWNINSDMTVSELNYALIYTENDKLTDLVYIESKNGGNQPIPREGHIGTVKFNTNLSIEEVATILSQLEYDDMGTAYVYYSNGTGVIIGSVDGQYMIANMTDFDNMIFNSSNGGWNPDFNGEIEVNGEVQPTGYDPNGNEVEYGLQNDLLVGLMYIEGEGNGSNQPVPREGYVEKIKFNTNLSVEEVMAIVSNVEFDYDRNMCYVIAGGLRCWVSINDTYSDLDAINIVATLYDEDGENEINSIVVFQNMDIDNRDGWVGWNPEFNGEFVLDCDVEKADPDGAELGAQNDLLVDLVYIEGEGNGNGLEIIVNDTKYPVDSTKLSVAVGNIETTLNALISGDEGEGYKVNITSNSIYSNPVSYYSLDNGDSWTQFPMGDTTLNNVKQIKFKINKDYLLTTFECSELNISLGSEWQREWESENYILSQDINVIYSDYD